MIADPAACLEDQQLTGRHIPRLQLAFPVAVQPSRRYVGKIECGRPGTPYCPGSHLEVDEAVKLLFRVRS